MFKAFTLATLASAAATAPADDSRTPHKITTPIVNFGNLEALKQHRVDLLGSPEKKERIKKMVSEIKPRKAAPNLRALREGPSVDSFGLDKTVVVVEYFYDEHCNSPPVEAFGTTLDTCESGYHTISTFQQI